MAGELYVKVGTSILTNPDVSEIGLDGLGAFILLIAYTRQWGHRGTVKIPSKKALMGVLRIESRPKMVRILNKLCTIKWLEIDYNPTTKYTITIPKWAKYQALLNKENTQKKPEKSTYSMIVDSREKNKNMPNGEKKELIPIKADEIFKAMEEAKAKEPN
jgi:uncharacterized protein YrzB (UPF0473 family)